MWLEIVRFLAERNAHVEVVVLNTPHGDSDRTELLIAVVGGRAPTTGRALFDSADTGFSSAPPQQPMTGLVGDMLWEADTLRFAERYPDSGIVESYGSQWPAPCIDYWVYVDVESRLATLSTQALGADRQEIALGGNGVDDADRRSRSDDEVRWVHQGLGEGGALSPALAAARQQPS